MKVRKIKSVIPDFDKNSGPSETVSLTLQVDDDFGVPLGTFYFGPYMIDGHCELYRKMVTFADECVRRFSEADSEDKEG